MTNIRRQAEGRSSPPAGGLGSVPLRQDQSSDGLLQGGDDIVVAVSVPVVAHGAALREALGVFQRDGQDAVFHLPCGKKQLHRVQSLAYIAAAGGGNISHGLRLDMSREAVFFRQEVYAAADGLLNLSCRNRFELEDRAPGENGVIDVKIGVFRRGCDQSDLAILYEFQQALLLLLGEILNLIQVEQNAVGGQKRI